MQIRPFVSSLKIIIYLFLAVVGTLVVVSGGYSLVVVLRLLIEVASPVVEHRFEGM